tara:strand:+ start:1792 stop:1992 length:201 start_codon:yes stop_codon:yes gene_type:complete
MKNKIPTKELAKILASEVMDENYRGTKRIAKHGETRETTNYVWKNIPNLINNIFIKYISYYGNRNY